MSLYNIGTKAYCGLHQMVKSMLGHGATNVKMFDVLQDEVNPEVLSELYPVENVLYDDSVLLHRESYRAVYPSLCLGVSGGATNEAWSDFIRSSKIPEGYKGGGLHYAGFIEGRGWCLPSWIWTNAALVRMYCNVGDLKSGHEIANRLLSFQEDCGGWIVRNDYTLTDVVPVLAPNDSSYIANNAMLSMYKITGEKRYLDSACRCADWIMASARPDGMVPIGYDIKRKVWQKHNIVDTGFTAALFASLYEITQEPKYYDFLKRFVASYIKLFYIPVKKGFATSLDSNDQQLGGMFARGQAWALEGIIPAYRVLQDDNIRIVIEDTISTILRLQRLDGGWAYNLTRPLMGEDCKGIAVIAKALMEWNEICPSEKLKDAARRALEWCRKHTAVNGQARGGIFSYCMEGAVVHHLYTSTAFVYASAYAIEVENKLKQSE